MGRQVLTIDTLEPDRDFIAINGKPYYLRKNEELSPIQQGKVLRAFKAVAGRTLGIESTEEDLKLSDASVNDILAVIVIDLPDDIRDRLGVGQKSAIVQAFTNVASSRRAGTETGQPERESQPITAGSSPGSGVSTEEVSPTT